MTPFFHRVLKSRQVIIDGGIVVALLVVAAFAPLIATHSYWQQDYMAVLKPPSTNHLLGTDNFGRDIFSRVIFGARTSLLTAVGTAALSGMVGILLGGLAGYFVLQA